MNAAKQLFIMAHPSARANALRAVAGAPEGYSVAIAPPTRNLEQNAAQWPILEAFSDQLQWPVNGVPCHLTADEWKDILSAAWGQETVRIVQGLDGGMVMLGKRTSKMSKAQFSEWLEFLHAVAAMRGVIVYPEGCA